VQYGLQAFMELPRVSLRFDGLGLGLLAAPVAGGPGG